LRFGADISFTDGLNIIFGPNSVGKTSIVTGIVYGLGGEKSLGIFKSNQNPFKPEFYKSISGHLVKLSYLLLEISNGKETVTIFRYIKGPDVNICAVKNGGIATFYETPDSVRYIAAGEGVFSENGFQFFIFNFLGCPLVELPTYDQKYSKLYFENILPLFFVEQRAGWSQIQARQVTRYNIKDVKKVAFEYLFGLDRFNAHLAELEVKDIESRLKEVTEQLYKKEENLMIISNGEKIDDILIIETPIGRTSIYDYINHLKDRYAVESGLINNLSSQNEEYEASNSKLKDALRILAADQRRIGERIDKITHEINGYQNYLDRIQSNKYKNRQLKKIQEISTNLNINVCPVCESRLEMPHDGECILCHADLSRKISTPDQNLAFLEDEENTFKKVINQRVFDRRKLIEQRNQILDQIKSFEIQLDHQTSTYAGREFENLRAQILTADNTNRELEKFTRIASRWEALDPNRKEIESIARDLEEKKRQLANYLETVNDETILNSIRKYIKENVTALGLFKGNKDLISAIKLDSNENYTPYLDDFDIYNISSSSDNIRIILSYYLALLQTSIELKGSERILYPNLLILDEPKQQNLDNDSLIDSIGVIEKIADKGSQIILTTYSELSDDKLKLQKHIIYEMKTKTDYLLKQLP
jgi:hypothetical protein